MRTLTTLISLLFFTTLARTQTFVLKDSTTFKNSSIPNPTIYTCNQDGEFMFRRCAGVRAEISNLKVEGIPVKVERFMISIAKPSGDTLIIENAGAYYQAAANNAFSALNVGDHVSLSDFIVIVGNEATPRKLTQVLSSVYSGKKYELRH
jgi:hypothetical protein